MKPSRQFLAAVTLAAIYKAPSLSLWQMFKAALKIGFALTGFGKKVDAGRLGARNYHCEHCEIHFSPLATCGSPLVDVDTGCLCHTKTKNRLVKADCWGRQHNKNYGWPDDLRPQASPSVGSAPTREYF